MSIIIGSVNPSYSSLAEEIAEILKEEVIFITKKEELNIDFVKKISPRFIFFPHWSYIIPAGIFENFECIVFHMTDLPFGRGGSPLQNLIVRGIKQTKISAICVVKELDAGPIYMKEPLDLSGAAREIFTRCRPIIKKMIFRILEEKIEPVPQTGEVTVFKRRTPDQSDISKLENINEIYDYIRMLDADGYPHAYLETENLRFEFTGASQSSDNIINANVRIIKK